MKISFFINKVIVFLLGKNLFSEDIQKVSQGVRKTINIQAASYLIVFLSNIIMVRVAGIKEYGIFINIINWISLLSIVASQGMEDVVLAEIPPRIAKGNFTGAFGVINFANRIIIIGAVLTCLLFILILFTGYISVFTQYQPLFFAALINVYLMSFVAVNQQALQAYNKFYKSQLADRLIKPLFYLVVLTVFLLLKVKAGAGLLINLTTIAQLTGAIMIYFFLRQIATIKGENIFQKKKENTLSYSSPNFYFFIISMLYLLKAKIAVIIFGFEVSSENTGIFNILCRLADFVILPVFIIHSIVPQLFSHHLEAEKSYKKELYKKITRLITAGALIIFIFIVIGGKFILELYGNSFVQYYGLLIALAASQLLYSFFGPSSAFLMMQGRQKQAAFVLLADIIISFFLFIIFIREYGLAGGVWATFISALLYNIILRVMVNKIIR